MEFIRNLIGKRRGTALVLAFFLCVLFTASIVTHKGSYFDLDPQKAPQKTPVISTSEGTNAPQLRRRVLLPAGYEFTKGVLDKHLTGTSAESWERVQLGESDVMQQPPLDSGSFKKTDFKLFESSSDTDCNVKQQEFDIFTGDSGIVPLNMNALFDIFQEEASVYGNVYNQHVGQVFKDNMTNPDSSKAWYVFSGSSVWLKAYNVHFVLSRLVYTEKSNPQDPRLSMILGQIFDENWNEVEDVRLVLPTNDVGNPSSFEEDGQTFISYRFPCILPAPFLLGKHSQFWGAEDPRMFLTRNEAGYEEPVIVFNALQDKEIVKDGKPDLRNLRTMFMSFPFQTQQGKGIYTTDVETKEQWYSRTKQIKVAGKEEKNVEKNWSPFVSNISTSNEHIYFATSLVPLQIIKCELWTDNIDCPVDFVDEGKLGDLRGGTPFYETMRVEEEDKEIFIGIGRSHLDNCGCGYAFYRPNVIVLSREKDQWSTTHVSSAIDLGIDIITWDARGDVCEKINAIIPNGIESWDFEKDELSVFVSNSDITVERVAVRGVLEALNAMKFWGNQKDKNTVEPVECAMEASKQFCVDYAKEIALKTAAKDEMAAFKEQD